MLRSTISRSILKQTSSPSLINATNQFFKPYIQSQKRGYIFVPSISEIYKTIYESFFQQSAKRKFLIIQKTKFQKKYKTIIDSYQLNRQELWDRYRDARSYSSRHRLFQRWENYNILSRIQQQRLLFSNYVIQHKARSKLRYNKYKERYFNNSIVQVIPLEEPIENAWFDEEGYPLATRDKITGRFINPWQSKTGDGTHSLFDFLSWKWQRYWRNTTALRQSNHEVASLEPSPEDKVKLVWIGHSTCFVQMNSFTILTDPMFSHRASLFQWPGTGVARSVPPSHSIRDLPDVDVVVISHDHYDHLDYNSIVALVDKVQHWCVPLGMKQWLLENIPGMNPDKISDMEWWQSMTSHKDDQEIKVTCAPAHHWSSRTPFDRNLRLWCSWAFTTSKSNKQLSFYFAGDTAYPQHFPLHSQITNKLGPFDLSAIPIGAYEPSFFMKDSHCNPYEALKIHKALDSRKSVAIHWGTFPLADEELHDPPLVLSRALEKEKGNEFVVVKHGQQVLSD